MQQDYMPYVKAFGNNTDFLLIWLLLIWLLLIWLLLIWLHCHYRIELDGDVTVCKTIGRLHFRFVCLFVCMFVCSHCDVMLHSYSETTLNNMRKKGKPNPDQK